MPAQNCVFAEKGLIGLFFAFLFFPTMQGFAQEVKFADEYAVFDANNKRVGREIGPIDLPQGLGMNSVLSRVAVEVDDTFFSLGVSRIGFGGAQTVFFESEDCTGTPLMDLPPTSLIFPTAVAVFGEDGQSGNIVYTPNLEETPSFINVHSIGLVTGCSSVDVTREFVPATKLVDLGEMFTPPFTVKPENKVGNDVNGDGYADLVWRNTDTGATAVWLMNESGFVDSATFPGGAGPNWIIQGVKDVNGDGYADLVWRNIDTGATATWLMNSDGLREAATFPGGAGDEWQLRP